MTKIFFMSDNMNNQHYIIFFLILCFFVIVSLPPTFDNCARRGWVFHRESQNISPEFPSIANKRTRMQALESKFVLDTIQYISHRELKKCIFTGFVYTNFVYTWSVCTNIIVIVTLKCVL